MVNGKSEMPRHAFPVLVSTEAQRCAFGYGYVVGFGTQGLQCWLLGDVEEELDSLDHDVHVVLVLEVVGEDHRFGSVVCVAEYYSAVALRAKEHGEEHEGLSTFDWFVYCVIQGV